MGTTKIGFIFSIMILIGVTGCAYESLTYRTVTDGLNNKEYIVVGRVRDSGSNPIENCRVFLTKQKRMKIQHEFVTCDETMKVENCLTQKQPEMKTVPVAITDRVGNYNLIFELDGATEFWLHFDARDQGYPIRYENFTHLLESSLFQYTGNNPVIVNVIIDKEPLQQMDFNVADQVE